MQHDDTTATEPRAATETARAELTGEELPSEAIVEPSSALPETEIAAINSDTAIGDQLVSIDFGLEPLPPGDESWSTYTLGLYLFVPNDLVVSLHYSETIGSDAELIDVEQNTEADDVDLDSALPLLFNRANPLPHWRAALSQSTVAEIQFTTAAIGLDVRLPVAEPDTSSDAAPNPIGSHAFIPAPAMVIAHRAVVAASRPEVAVQESAPDREKISIPSTADAVEVLLHEYGSGDGQTGTVLPFALSDAVITRDALWAPLKAVRQGKPQAR